jgi:hypothetical protein
MRKPFDVAFGLGLIALALSVLMAIPSDTSTSSIARILVPVLAVATGALFVLRRRATDAVGVGLLKPGRYPPLDKKEHAAMTLRVINVLMDGKASQGSTTAQSIVTEELSRLTAEWTAKRRTGVQTGPETRSLFQLANFALANIPDEKRAEYLKDVADPKLFHALRQKVLPLETDKQTRQQDFADWKASVGKTDMTHLLKDGWIAFLRHLPAPDPVLWHGIATDFHAIEARGRLEAAFWILAQPECDRATASDFIRGFVAVELLERTARAGDTQRLAAFHDVITRYNSAFYRWFGIVPDAGGIEPIAEALDGPFDDTAVARMMDRIVRDTGIKPLPKPVGLLGHDTRPDHPMPGLNRSPYDFWDDAGLHLRYPGPGWRSAAG